MTGGGAARRADVRVERERDPIAVIKLRGRKEGRKDGATRMCRLAWRLRQRRQLFVAPFLRDFTLCVVNKADKKCSLINTEVGS